jgi:hypothetical protein
MFISKMHLSRRTVLKGLGVSLGLPLLDAMIPAATALARTAAAPRPCMAFVYFPHGAVMEKWTPVKDGADFDLPPILTPLAPFQKQLTVISGLENKAGAVSPVHATTPNTWLRCAPPLTGITVDQIAARAIGLPSIEVGTEEAEETISLPMEHDPGKLFRRLFGQGEPSVVDVVRHDAAALSRTLGPRDRALLDDYLGTVREIEGRVHQVGTPEERMQLMFDLLALAYQANVTRVSTYVMAAEVGVADAFHNLAHHQNDAAKMERLAKVQARHTELFAGFVRKLAEMPDGDGSMLDHSLIVYGSNMSNSQLHNHFPLPTAVVGGGCGRLQGNQHLRCPDRTPLANLHVSLLNKVGVPTRSFGDSTGEI